MLCQMNNCSWRMNDDFIVYLKIQIITYFMGYDKVKMNDRALYMNDHSSSFV